MHITLRKVLYSRDVAHRKIFTSRCTWWHVLLFVPCWGCLFLPFPLSLPVAVAVAVSVCTSVSLSVYVSASSSMSAFATVCVCVCLHVCACTVYSCQQWPRQSNSCWKSEWVISHIWKSQVTHSKKKRFMSALATAEQVPFDPSFFYGKYLQWLINTNITVSCRIYWVAECCIVLQHVAACCSVLQRVAACRSVAVAD